MFSLMDRRGRVTQLVEEGNIVKECVPKEEDHSVHRMGGGHVQTAMENGNFFLRQDQLRFVLVRRNASVL